MLSLAHSVAPKSILLIGAHCDDIEIGCGATVLQLVEKFPGAHFDWVVFSSTPARAEEAMRSCRYNAFRRLLKECRNTELQKWLFSLYWGPDQRLF